MSQDFGGYYATLGVSSTSSAAEIKAAYRRLVKTHHPDSGTTQSDAEIKRLNEAYAVVGDPERRAAYDSEGLRTEPAQAAARQRIDPIRCGQCSKVAAQPRYLIFWRVYSLLLATGRVPIQGIFCAACAKSEAIKSTAFTALLGWWGIPWGPIWTVANGFKNALGGEQEEDRNEILAWHNVVAFMQAGQVPLAYALAEKLQGSRDRKIAAAAADLTSLCRSNGFAPQGELKDTWQAVRAQAPLRIAILMTIPILVGGLFLYDSATPSNASTSATEPMSYSYSDPAPLAESASASAEPIAAVATCGHTPRNGQILTGKSKLRAEGHELDIENGSSGNAIIKVRDANSNRLYASFYVEKGQSASLPGIADGNYKFQYALGNILGEDCKSFIGDYSVSEFPNDEHFAKEYVNDYTGEGYMYNRLSFTLYTVPGGNIRPVGISNAEFDAN